MSTASDLQEVDAAGLSAPVEDIEDRNLIATALLRSPRSLKEELPLSAAARRTVAEARRAVRDILAGRDARRLLVISGPCSLHDREAALDYARRLRALSVRHEGEMALVMRTYFEKPRTTIGWKGMINDPDLDGRCDIERGLAAARRLLLEINELGVACATEVLDPVTPQYVADLIAWAAIGARTTESQTHREIASGLSMPVGFKNATGGDLEGARNAMLSAREPHSFLGITPEGAAAVIRTRGNADRQIVLRGGGGVTNFDAASIAAAAALVADQEIARPVVVDCSHGNSCKDPARQAEVAREVVATWLGGPTAVAGILLESHIEEGRQDWRPDAPLRYGVSLTDACIGWAETEALLDEVAATIVSARNAASAGRPERSLRAVMGNGTGDGARQSEAREREADEVRIR